MVSTCVCVCVQEGTDDTYLSQARLTGAVVVGLEAMREEQASVGRLVIYLMRDAVAERIRRFLLVQQTCCACIRGDIFEGSLCNCA